MTDQSNPRPPPYFFKIRFNIVFYLCLGLPCCLFPPPTHVPHAPVIALAFISSPNEQYISRSSSSLSLLHAAATSFLIFQIPSSAPHSRTQSRFRPPVCGTIFRIQLTSIYQVFGFIFLCSTIKTNDSGPMVRSILQPKNTRKLLIWVYRTQHNTVQCIQIDCTQKKIVLCCFVLCDGGSRVDLWVCE